MYPAKNDLSAPQRTGLSIVLSVVAVMLIVLFIDEWVAVNSTPANITAALLIFSLLAVIVWRTELVVLRKAAEFQGESGHGRKIRLPLPRAGFHFFPQLRDDTKSAEKRMRNRKK